MPDTASVKISSDAKIFLDTLQQKLRAAGIKITEQKIMDILIENADVVRIKKLLRKEENTALAMLRKPLHWGVADSSENIDRYVYEDIDEPAD